METLLTAAIVLTALAIIVQAGVLVGMYLSTRRVTNNINALTEDARRLLAPLEYITNNLRVTSDDLMESGKIVREQVHHIEGVVNETRERILGEITTLRAHAVESFDDARDTVMRPVQQWSAIARAVAEGFRVFVGRKSKPTEPRIVTPTEPLESVESVDIIVTEDREFPAA